MNCKTLCYSLGLLVVTTACAPTAVPGGASRTTATAAINYNGYNDDLTATRPAYTVPASAPAPTTPPASKTDAAVVAVRKPASVGADAVRRSDTSGELPHINKRLDALLDTIAQTNRSVRYASGYRIQVYVGNERQEADAAKLMVYQSFPELSPYLSYKQPTYRLKIGDFMRRLDAEWYLSQLKQQFKSVILQPDKVDIRRSLLIK